MTGGTGRRAGRGWDPRLGELFAAGERVPPGSYREVESGRQVRLEREGRLPACLDGRAARYARVTWPGSSPDRASASAHDNEKREKGTTMAERNPNIPHERRREVEGRTRFNEDEANRRFAEKQAKVAAADSTFEEARSAEARRTAGADTAPESGAQGGATAEAATERRDSGVLAS